MDFVTLFLTPHLDALGVLSLFAAVAAIALGIVGAPDAGGGDPDPNADPNPAGGDPDPEAGGDPDPDPARRAAGAEEELDEDEVDLPPEVRDDPKRLRTRYRRLQRQHGAVARIAERFRGADGRYLQPQEIDRMVGRAQDMDELEALLDEHPDLTQQILARKRGGPAAAAAAPAEWQDPYTAEVLAKVAFDPEHESSKWFLNEFRRLDKRNFELQSTVKKLETGVGSVQQDRQQERSTQVEQTWKTETLAAANAAGLQGEDLKDFVNYVYASFRAGKAEGRLEKIDRKQMIERALRPFKRTRGAGERRAAVAAHGRAEGNRTLPGPHNRAAASPASPQDKNKVGNIRDGRKSFFLRLGMGAPAGGR